MSVDPDAIPDDLRERDQWLLWSNDSEPPKMPLNADGYGASWTDPSEWLSFEQAVELAETDDFDGIGYVISEGDPYLGLDLDGCLREPFEEKPKDWLPALDAFEGTYVEYSTSGTGLHPFVRGDRLPEWWTDSHFSDEEHEGVEAYTSKFFIVTGEPVDALSAPSIEDVDIVPFLLDAYRAINDDEPRLPGGSSPADGPDVGIYDVISRSDHPEGQNSSHPFHGSETGSNFRVDEGGETFRCWRHSVTGNGAHLLGIDRGVIDCGDWDGDGLDSDTWSDIFAAGREAGYDIPEPRAAADGGAAAAQPDADGPPGPGPDAGVGDGEDGLGRLFREACDYYHVDPDRVDSFTNEDGRVWLSVEDILNREPRPDDVASAVMSFNERAAALSGNQRQAVIARVVSVDLEASGEFFKTPHGELYYYHEDAPEDSDRMHRADGDGHRILNEDFQAFVWEQYHLLAGQFSRNLGKDMLSYIRRNAPEREVHRFAHFDESAGEVYITDHGDGYYAISAEGVEWRPNGTDLFFLGLDRAEPFDYLEPEDRPDLPDRIPGERSVWGGNGDAIMRLFGNRINYSEQAALGPAQQRKQLYLHLHALPFGSVLVGKPIMAWVGDKGSGKTMTSRAIGRFFIGPEFTESAMPDERDDFEAKVINQPLAFIDNYDEGEDWANSILASIATGGGLDKRELYTTSGLRSEVPDCWLSLTSREPPFRRDDVADRLLLFHVERFEGEFIGAGNFLNEVAPTDEHPDRRDHLWSVYLDNIHAILRELEDRDLDNMSSSHRMAGWAIYASVIADALGIEDVDELLETMQAERATFALEEENWASVIGKWIDEEPGVASEFMGAGKVHEWLEKTADGNDMTYNVGGAGVLGRKLSKYRDELGTVYGLEIDEDGKRNEYRFSTEAGVGLGRFG